MNYLAQILNNFLIKTLIVSTIFLSFLYDFNDLPQSGLILPSIFFCMCLKLCLDLCSFILTSTSQYMLFSYQHLFCCFNFFSCYISCRCTTLYFDIDSYYKVITSTSKSLIIILTIQLTTFLLLLTATTIVLCVCMRFCVILLLLSNCLRFLKNFT